MKILAISGSNLASLAGQFRIDLSAPPLADAGLFAITGPTGAGKSTLLDALSLALFDQVPRLPRGLDARGLLRRGAAQGHAEVDFRGRDGRGWRSRWSVRRARGRSDGNLQPVDMVLESLDGRERLAGAKTEVLAGIGERIGLSFEQFRRSVLLAQGEFAAFLKAKADQRSELLELITGTGLYSRLSILAFERAREERTGLAGLEAAWAAVRPLGDEERRQLEEELDQAGTTIAEAQAVVTVARAALVWHQALARLERDRAEAETRSRASQAALEAAQPRRQALAAVLAVQPLRPVLGEAERTAAEARTAATALATALGELERAAAAVAGAEAAVGQTHTGWQAALDARQTAEPGLEEAAGLDRQYTELAAGLAEAEQTLATVGERRRRLEQEAARLATDAAAVAAERARVSVRLAADAGLAPVAAQWERWQAEINRFAQAGTALADTAAQAAGIGDQIARTAAALPERGAAVDTAATALASAAAALDEERRRTAPSLEACRATREAAEKRLRETETLTRAVGEAGRLTEALLAARDQQRKSQAAAAQADAAALAAEQESAALQPARAEAEHARDRLRLALREDVASLRRQLEVGERCPVCWGVFRGWAAAQSRFDGEPDVEGIDNVVQDQLGIPTQALTAAEAASPGNFRDADALRARAATAEGAGRVCLGARGFRPSGAAEGGVNPGAELTSLAGTGGGPQAERNCDDSPLHRLAQEQDARVRDLRTRCEAAAVAAACHRAAAKAARTQDAAAGQAAHTHQNARDALTGTWRAATDTGLSLPPLPWDEAAPAAVAALLDAAGAALTAARLEEDAVLARERHLQALDRKRQTATERLNQERMALDRAQRELERLEGERALAESTRDHAGRQQAASLALLAEPLAGIADRREVNRGEAGRAEAGRGEAGWAEALAADPVRFSTGLARRCTAFQQDRERLAGLERRQETLAGETRTKAVEVEAAASRTREADALKSQFSERRQAVAQRRAALFEGRPVTAVRAALERAQTAAAAALDRARRTQEAARSAAAAAARELETRRHLAEERQAAAQAADATLARALATEGVELAELRRRLAHDGAWQTREATGLRALEQAAADDDIRRDERRRLVDAHQTNPPALTADEAAPRLQTAETALAAAQEQRSERLVRLRDDESRRAQASVLAGRLAQQRRTQELWEDLARLIGSADGKKFRTFAQQVSLDLLLAHANHHLGQLARRYRLEQICDGSLELQVIDRDLADDMRSVHSLSGGETFLVSLALALGLSSMTGGAAIGTLFIDEGFGALDPDSLDQAVACLETLQASGRQVGVVSHIPALVERIGVQVRVSTEGGGRSRVQTVRTGWAGVEETES